MDPEERLNDDTGEVPAEHGAGATDEPDNGPPPGRPGWPGRPPIWVHFLTPVAILVGAAAVVAAILITDDDGGGGDGGAVVAAPPGDSSEAGGATPTVSAASAATSLRSLFVDYASQVGLDGEEFGVCYDTQLGGEATTEGETPAVEVINADLQAGVRFGVNATPSFLVNDKLIVGAQPAAIFDEVIGRELEEEPPTEVSEYSAQVQQLAESGRFQIVTGQEIDLSSAAIEGDPDADVLVVEFSDFQCPFCRRWENDYGRELRERAGEDIALAFVHFPLQQIHPNAPFAAVASICAAEEGEFWAMHDVLFARQDEWANAAAGGP